VGEVIGRDKCIYLSPSPSPKNRRGEKEEGNKLL